MSVIQREFAVAWGYSKFVSEQRPPEDLPNSGIIFRLLRWAFPCGNDDGLTVSGPAERREGRWYRDEVTGVKEDSVSLESLQSKEETRSDGTKKGGTGNEAACSGTPPVLYNQLSLGPATSRYDPPASKGQGR